MPRLDRGRSVKSIHSHSIELDVLYINARTVAADGLSVI